MELSLEIDFLELDYCTYLEIRVCVYRSCHMHCQWALLILTTLSVDSYCMAICLDGGLLHIRWAQQEVMWLT